jgi:hypothetical protein
MTSRIVYGAENRDYNCFVSIDAANAHWLSARNQSMVLYRQRPT